MARKRLKNGFIKTRGSVLLKTKEQIKNDVCLSMNKIIEISGRYNAFVHNQSFRFFHWLSLEQMRLKI